MTRLGPAGEHRGARIPIRSLPFAIALGLAVAAAGCGEPGSDELEPFVSFDTTTVTIESAGDTMELTVEVAESNEQRAYGLMDRTELPADHGMLFRYPEPQDSTAGFWMFRTRIPLDIAFLDADGRILAIRAMDPCESPDPRFCQVYSPGVEFTAALEVRRGFFERHGIREGDRIRVTS